MAAKAEGRTGCFSRINPARAWRPALLLLAVALFLALRWGLGEDWHVADERVGEIAWRWLADTAPERRLVVVDIDETSLERIGPWPWPRETLARLIERIAAAGSGPILLDIVFPAPRPGDARLAQAMKRTQAVAAQVFALGETAPVRAGRLASPLPRISCPGPFPVAHGYIANAPGLVAQAGHITPWLDADGAVRRLPPLICFDGRAYPALALVGLARLAAVGPHWRLESGGLLGPAYRLSHPGLPGLVVPLDAHGLTRVPYRHARAALLAVPAADLLEGRAPPAWLEGALVLVGATALGIADAVPTPQHGAVGGVEVHAQFLLGLLEGLPYTPSAAVWLLLIEAVLGAGLLGWIAGRPGRLATYGLPAVAVLLALASFFLALGLLAAANLWLGWIDLPAFFLLAGSLLLIGEQALTARQRDRLYRQFASFLPEPVVARLAEKEPSAVIEAEHREITCLFADIRHFSAFCEASPPEAVAEMLHRFFGAAAAIVEAHGGLIDKYIGDAVMALWNAVPGEGGGPRPEAALAAARDLQRFARDYFATIQRPGLPRLALGIGIESGPALVGHFGTTARRTYTALGETVTLAARLEAFTARCGHGTLLGEGAAARLAPGRVRPLGQVHLPGLHAPHTIYAPTEDEDAPAAPPASEPHAPASKEVGAGFKPTHPAPLCVEGEETKPR